MFLGLTVGCAQCHDHKYDPISQREYYQLFAFFNSDVEKDIDAPLPGEAERYRAQEKAHDAKSAELKSALEQHRSNFRTCSGNGKASLTLPACADCPPPCAMRF